MYENIDEKIDVVALFGRRHQDVKPFRMKWQGRQYTITHVDYKHKLKQGDKVLYFFSCSDGANYFELRFDANELGWFLGKIWDGNVS